MTAPRRCKTSAEASATYETYEALDDQAGSVVRGSNSSGALINAILRVVRRSNHPLPERGLRAIEAPDHLSIKAIDSGLLPQWEDPQIFFEAFDPLVA